jgi:hypothetical protein
MPDARSQSKADLPTREPEARATRPWRATAVIPVARPFRTATVRDRPDMASHGVYPRGTTRWVLPPKNGPRHFSGSTTADMAPVREHPYEDSLLQAKPTTIQCHKPFIYNMLRSPPSCPLFRLARTLLDQTNWQRYDETNHVHSTLTFVEDRRRPGGWASGQSYRLPGQSGITLALRGRPAGSGGRLTPRRPALRVAGWQRIPYTARL